MFKGIPISDLQRLTHFSFASNRRRCVNNDANVGVARRRRKSDAKRKRNDESCTSPSRSRSSSSTTTFCKGSSAVSRQRRRRRCRSRCRWRRQAKRQSRPGRSQKKNPTGLSHSSTKSILPWQKVWYFLFMESNRERVFINPQIQAEKSSLNKSLSCYRASYKYLKSGPMVLLKRLKSKLSWVLLGLAPLCPLSSVSLNFKHYLNRKKTAYADL